MKTWLLVCILLALTLGGAEVFWRSRGFAPSVRDDAQLWCLARGQLHENDPRQIVLIGASRAQLDLDTATLAAMFGGRRPIQLAISGSNCLPVLRDLSETSFRGIVICDVAPWFFFQDPKPDEATPEEYVRQFENRNGSWWLEACLHTWVQSHFVLRLPTLAPDRLWAAFRKGEGPVPDFQTVFADRCVHADYTRADPGLSERLRMQRERAVVHPSSPTRLARDLDDLQEMVRKIQGRGGRVVFVLLPTNDSVRDFEERHWPRRQYWDQLAARMGPWTIHFADYPSLSGFRCPEGSHLDYREAIPFTKELGLILRTKLQQEP